MTKIVINSDFGGFGLTCSMRKRYEELTGKPLIYDSNLDRTDPVLVQVVEEHIDDTDHDLMIEEVPEGTEYIIHEYDGLESIWTKDNMNWSIA